MSLSKKSREEKRQYWAALVKQWEKSKLTQTEFCKRKNIKVSNFSKWRQRLPVRKSDPMLLPADILLNPSPGIDSKQQPVDYFKIKINERYVIEIPSTLSGHQLKVLFSSLGINHA